MAEPFFAVWFIVWGQKFAHSSWSAVWASEFWLVPDQKREMRCSDTRQVQIKRKFSSFCSFIYLAFLLAVACFAGLFGTVFPKLEKKWVFSKEPFSVPVSALQARPEAEGCVPNRQHHLGHSEQERDRDRPLHQCLWHGGERGGISLLWDQGGWQGENCDLPSPAFHSLPHRYSQLQPRGRHARLQRVQLRVCQNHAFRYAHTGLQPCLYWAEIKLGGDKLS